MPELPALPGFGGLLKKKIFGNLGIVGNAWLSPQSWQFARPVFYLRLVINTKVQDRIGFLTFNRPDKLNALNAELLSGSIETLRSWSTDAEVGAVVITGILLAKRDDRRDLLDLESRLGSVAKSIIFGGTISGSIGKPCRMQFGDIGGFIAFPDCRL